MAKRNRGNWEDRSLVTKLGDRLTMTWRLLVDGRVSLGHKLIPIVAVLYVLSPIDFIPDVFLPFGVVDDPLVFLGMLEFFIRMSPAEVVQEHWKDLREGNAEPEDVVEGEYKIKR